MTQISKASFNTTYADSAGTFADNTTRAISEADLRQFSQDIKDSVPFNLDGTDISVKVTVATGSILTANATPVTLVAAQGAGTVIDPISCYVWLDYNSVTYATNTDLTIVCNGYVLGTIPSFLASGSDQYGKVDLSANTNINQSNQALTLSVSVGNPTAGNSPVYVYLKYRVITL
jgi:hypothetical protein